MRGGVRVLALLLAFGAQSAWGQGLVVTPGPGATLGGPGVDVFTPLYPQPPQSTVTRTTPSYPGPPLGVTAYQDPPTGIPAGNVIIYPSLTAATFFDDNIFARSNNRQGDWAFVLRPEVAWRSNNWTNAEVAAQAFLEKRWYRQFSSEDQINAGAAIGGTYQPDADTQLVGRAAWLHAHEDRGTSENINNTFTKPISYDQVEVAGAINKRFNRVWTSLGAAAAWIHYEDPTIIGTGFVVPQAYRNGDIIRVPGRLGYVVAPLTSVFVEVSGNRRNFDVDSFDSTGWRAVGGMLFEPGPGARVRGEFFVGYMGQDYSGVGFQNVSTWTYGIGMAFLVAPNVTAVVEGRRDAREASLSGGVVPGDGVSLIESVIAARADVLVARNFVIGGGLAYVVDEFLGAGRTDHTWSPLASARYFVNPYLTLGFDYRYLNFDSSGFAVPSYYRNVYMFSANLRI
jgi:hypothetical protein